MFNYESKQVQQDLDELLKTNIPWNKLKNKKILITGASGMLASYAGFLLIHLNGFFKLNIEIILLARKKESLLSIYEKYIDNVTCLVQDVCVPFDYKGRVDYIIHAAGNSSPFHIINDPVGIIDANVKGTKNILEFAKTSNPTNIVFTSTREIYGEIKDKSYIKEEDVGFVDPLNPRSCYPESKRLAESMFMAYYKQYGIPFNIIRIAHCYGPGMQIENDGRVMADLIKDSLKNEEIILKSSGEAERAFCYVKDAVSGIFRVLLQGENTNAYNLANEKEPIRIIDLAKLMQIISGSNKPVSISVDPDSTGYTNYKRTALSTEKIEKLGWNESVGLEDGLKRTLNFFRN